MKKKIWLSALEQVVFGSHTQCDTLKCDVDVLSNQPDGPVAEKVEIVLKLKSTTLKSQINYWILCQTSITYYSHTSQHVMS